MSSPEAIVALVTLGVSNLARSIAFYEALGFRRKARAAEGVAFFAAGGVAFAVFPTEDLAKDAGLAASPVAGFRGVALAWNCPSEPDVDSAFARALAAGAKMVKTP